jgi:hypothetical protein
VVVGDDNVMQEHLGHADIGITLGTYTHSSPSSTGWRASASTQCSVPDFHEPRRKLAGVEGSTSYDLWIDYHRVDLDGITHAHLRNARKAENVGADSYIVVGAEDAESAVAKVVESEGTGVVLVRVLPGSVETRLEVPGPA